MNLFTIKRITEEKSEIYKPYKTVTSLQPNNNEITKR